MEEPTSLPYHLPTTWSRIPTFLQFRHWTSDYRRQTGLYHLMLEFWRFRIRDWALITVLYLFLSVWCLRSIVLLSESKSLFSSSLPLPTNGPFRWDWIGEPISPLGGERSRCSEIERWTSEAFLLMPFLDRFQGTGQRWPGQRGGLPALPRSGADSGGKGLPGTRWAPHPSFSGLQRDLANRIPAERLFGSIDKQKRGRGGSQGFPLRSKPFLFVLKSPHLLCSTDNGF